MTSAHEDNKSDRKKHFIINVFLGIAIAVFLLFVEHTDWGEANINSAFDFMIKSEAEKSAQAMKSLTTPRNIDQSDRIVFVDIDHETYKKWERPLITPRTQLAKIIKIADKGKAKIIAIDILLEDEDCCHPENDRELRNVLQEMTSHKSPTKIIFPVRVDSEERIIKNIFQDLIDHNPNFHIATVQISASVTDRVVRYWVPFNTIKTDSDNVVLWHMSFLMAMLDKEKESEIREFEKTVTAGKFQNVHHFKLDNDKTIAIHPENDEIYSNRIRFLLLPKNTLPAYPSGNLFDNIYRVDEIKHVIFKDKIVVIGNSSPDIGDIHPTPVGTMAGMFIIGNAVNTISLGLQPFPSPLWLKIMIDVFIIIMASLVFLYFKPFWAQIISYIVIIPTLGVLSWFVFLHTGMFLNAIFALIGINFHTTIANIEENLNK